MLTLSRDLAERLEALAVRLERPVADCARQALMDFLHDWEDHLHGVAALTVGEARPILRAVNDGPGYGLSSSLSQ